MNTKLFYSVSIVLWLLPQISSAAVDSKTTSILTVDKTVHFLMADGSDGVVGPGVFLVEDAGEWLRLISGERRDALLLEAIPIHHEENLNDPKALLQLGETHEPHIVLLLPGGRGLEAIGSISGVRSRAVKRPLTSRLRTQRQRASRIPTQSKNNTVIKKSKPITKYPVQPNTALTQRVQTLEQQIGTLLATIDSLQSRLTKIESAVQVSNSGMVTINGATLKFIASLVDVRAGIAKFSGVVQSDAVITKSVVSASYTPGAGNIW